MTLVFRAPEGVYKGALRDSNGTALAELELTAIATVPPSLELSVADVTFPVPEGETVAVPVEVTNRGHGAVLADVTLATSDARFSLRPSLAQVEVLAMGTAALEVPGGAVSHTL